MERALLQGERQAEQEQVEAETDIIAQLQLKLSQLDKATQREKDKVEPEDTHRLVHSQTHADTTHAYTHTHIWHASTRRARQIHTHTGLDACSHTVLQHSLNLSFSLLG